MIRTVRQFSIKNRLERLEKRANNITAIPIMFGGVDADGRISLFQYVGAPVTYYENLFDAETALTCMRGVGEDTKLWFDDMPIHCDGLYLPNEPIEYFCNPDERKQFLHLTDKSEWLRRYIEIARRAQRYAIENPAAFLPWLKDEALQDLLKHYEIMTVDEMAARYSEMKWFSGNKK